MSVMQLKDVSDAVERRQWCSWKMSVMQLKDVSDAVKWCQWLNDATLSSDVDYVEWNTQYLWSLFAAGCSRIPANSYTIVYHISLCRMRWSNRFGMLSCSPGTTVDVIYWSLAFECFVAEYAVNSPHDYDGDQYRAKDVKTQQREVCFCFWIYNRNY